MVPEFAVVVGVDEHTLQYLDITMPTWWKNQPHLFNRPWVAFCDHRLTERQVKEVVPHAKCVRWEGASDYASQREKMLSGHVYISNFIETPWFLKIDCDALACLPVEWPRAEWFAGEPVTVSSNNGYTRAKGDDRTLEEWIEALDSFGDKYYGTPREEWLHLIKARNHPRGPKMNTRRMVSWLCFQRTEWVRELSALFAKEYGFGKLPVPSHDTSLWWMARRSGRQMFAEKVVDHGWENRVTLKGVRELADAILG